MNGKKKEEYTGFNTVKVLPFLKDLIDNQKKTEKFPGLLENMSLKISTNTNLDFENMIFIDTPGLADGNLRYKFNIEESLEWFADKSDIILVFFDP